MAEEARLRGNSEELSRIVVSLIDEYLDQHPETPMETICSALQAAKALYNLIDSSPDAYIDDNYDSLGQVMYSLDTAITKAEPCDS